MIKDERWEKEHSDHRKGSGSDKLYMRVWCDLAQAGGKENVYTIHNYRSMWISVTYKLMKYKLGKEVNHKGTKSRHIW